MEKLKKILLPVGLVLILLLPILINYISSNKISVVKFDEFKERIQTGEVTLTYVGNTDSEDYKLTKESLLQYKKAYEITVSSMNISDLADDARETLQITDETKELYIITSEGQLVKSLEDSSKVDAQLNKYVNNVIPEDEIAYKTVSTYKEFKTIIESKQVTMHVFGRNSCYYCNIFKPVYNDAASEYDIDIYYYDSDNFDSTEYTKILNSGLTIPAECTSSKEETSLSSGFGTPLTLFTKKGKVVGCISGYTTAEKLETKLKSVGMIK